MLCAGNAAIYVMLASIFCRTMGMKVHTKPTQTAFLNVCRITAWPMLGYSGCWGGHAQMTMPGACCLRAASPWRYEFGHPKITSAKDGMLAELVMFWNTQQNCFHCIMSLRVLGVDLCTSHSTGYCRLAVPTGAAPFVLAAFPSP